MKPIKSSLFLDCVSVCFEGLDRKPGDIPAVEVVWEEATVLVSKRAEVS